MNIKYYFKILLGLVAIYLFASCNPDKVDSLDFDVAVRNDVREIFVGDEVDVESMSLSYMIKQQYTEVDYQNRAIMEIYLSKDFDGIYTADGIAKANWIKLSGMGEGQLKVPTCLGVRDEIVSDEADFSLYKDEKFYLAFRYLTPEVPGIEKGQPRVDIQPLTLTKKVEGSIVTITNPAKDVDVWAISQQIDAASVAPDQGEPIKSLDMKSPSYSYRYTSPGEYTVTFVALNANMWNTRSRVKEIKIVVKEK